MAKKLKPVNAKTPETAKPEAGFAIKAPTQLRNPKIEPAGVEKVRVSGYLIDHTIRYIKPKEDQLSLFDALLEDTKQEISPKNKPESDDLSALFRGLDLEQEEFRMLFSLVALLHQKSENTDLDSPRFGLGNELTEQVMDSNRGDMLSVGRMSFYEAELLKILFGTDSSSEVSGRHIENARRTFANLAEKRFLLRYTEKYSVPGSKKGVYLTLANVRESYKPLYEIETGADGLTAEEMRKWNSGDAAFRRKRRKIFVRFHPIVVADLRDFYSVLPLDLNRRMIQAAGGAKKLTDSDWRLVLKLVRMKTGSKGRNASASEMDFENLIRVLQIEHMRLGRIKERLQKSFQIALQVGLLTRMPEKVRGERGQEKYRFSFNLNWPSPIGPQHLASGE